jgi:hypothetical protein
MPLDLPQSSHRCFAVTAQPFSATKENRSCGSQRLTIRLVKRDEYIADRGTSLIDRPSLLEEPTTDRRGANRWPQLHAASDGTYPSENDDRRAAAIRNGRCNKGAMRSVQKQRFREIIGKALFPLGQAVSRRDW